VNEEKRAVLEAKKVPALLPGPGSEDDNGLPPPSSRGMLGKARAVANRAFAETIPVEADGHGNGHHGNGHAVTGEEPEAVGATGPAALPPGEGGEDWSGTPGDLPHESRAWSPSFRRWRPGRRRGPRRRRDSHAGGQRLAARRQAGLTAAPTTAPPR
jgi:hypothetical protein